MTVVRVDRATPDVRTWVSPYTALPRRCPWARVSRSRQRLVNLGVFALVPSLLFWGWYATEVVDRLATQPPTLRWAMPTAALWVTVAPLLMQHAEFRLEDLLSEFSRRGVGAGWNLAAMRRCLEQWDRAFYPTVLPIGLATMLALAWSFEPLDRVIPVRDGWERIAGLAVIGTVGLCSAAGIWGISKAIALVHAATRDAVPRWTPFRAERAWGIRQLYVFAWGEGLMFSCGGLFAPAMLGVQPYLTPVSRVVVRVFVVLLLVGGLTVFSVPAWLLHRVTLRGQQRALDALAPAVEEALAVVTDRASADPDRVARELTRLHLALRLWQVVATAQPSPFAVGYLGRAATTLVLPIALTTAQIVSTH